MKLITFETQVRVYKISLNVKKGLIKFLKTRDIDEKKVQIKKYWLLRKEYKHFLKIQGGQ